LIEHLRQTLYLIEITSRIFSKVDEKPGKRPFSPAAAAAFSSIAEQTPLA
jgi:hypothetical protein